MEREINQLIEMGATRAQARAALRKHKDVMEAAEGIFGGCFDNVVDEDSDVEMPTSNNKLGSSVTKPRRMITPDEDEDEDDDEDENDGDSDDDDNDFEGGEDDSDDDMDGFVDYDSDYDAKAEAGKGVSTADPYAGIFFSKDRKEEVIEVEEEPETAFVPDANETVKIMTQGQWMKGCPEGGEQGFLFGLYQELTSGECRCPNGCSTVIKRQKKDFFSLFSDFSVYISHLLKIVPQTCKKCSKIFCYACGEPITETHHSKVHLQVSCEGDCLFHCPNLQGVILGVGLAMLEQAFTQDVLVAPPCGEKPQTNKRRKADTPIVNPVLDDWDDEDNDGYFSTKQNKKMKLGVGYAGDAREDNTGQLEAQAIQKAKDEKLSNLLSSIGVYLPSLHREGGGKPSDYLPHPTALAHLRRRFNFVSSQLLRNDSLADMSDRSMLYFGLLQWLETISCHEALASMMAMPIMVVTSVKSSATKRSGFLRGPSIRERTIIYEGSSGPRELLEAIVIQAQAAIKGLEPPKPTESPVEEQMTEDQKRMTNDDKGKEKEQAKTVSDENWKLLDFCQRILSTAKAIDRALRETKGDAFVERLHAALPKIPGSSGCGSKDESVALVDVGATEEDTQKAYIEWANRARFEYCDLTVENEGSDDTPHYKFYFNNEARMLANSDIPKRSLAIAKELAVLTTNLPVAWDSSVFIRVDETRVDVIKALITGPEGTPYYNGCYLFDIFLGPSYNQAPPNVKYMTTNGGKYRFNPNLYADGKVCLSLLGTWQGPGWVAGKSTLLQVLISIQSMILCEEPYLNEPGWANSGGTPQSQAYSANVRRMVVKTAMLGNLKNPPEPFADVIRTHFRLKAKSITKQLDQWLAIDDGKGTNSDGAYTSHPQFGHAGGSNNGYRKDIEEMKTLLDKLAKGQSIDS